MKTITGLRWLNKPQKVALVQVIEDETPSYYLGTSPTGNTEQDCARDIVNQGSRLPRIVGEAMFKANRE